MKEHPADAAPAARARPHLERWASMRVLKRLPQVIAGTGLLGLGIAFMASARLGFGPWSVLAEGVSDKAGISLGVADILLGIPILLAWLVIRAQPGIGTVVSALGVGIAINVGSALLPEPGPMWARGVMTSGGVMLVGIGVGLYVAADLGPGPRDGLMTGLHHRLGWSIRLVRTMIEGLVLLLGFLLGGTVGVGTLLMALAVGSVIQTTLRVFDPEGRVMMKVASTRS